MEKFSQPLKSQRFIRDVCEKEREAEGEAEEEEGEVEEAEAHALSGDCTLQQIYPST